MDAGEQLAGHHDALDLVGALVDLGDLGVAQHPLDRVVAGVAVAATALVVTSIATSEAKHLAAAPKKVRSESPRSDRPAAAYVIWRATSTFMPMSASMNCRPWNSAIDLPNCWRSRA